MIKIAIVDDEALFRKGLIRIIEDMDGVNIVYEASNGEEFLAALPSLQKPPEIVVLDLNMPIKNGIETSKELKQNYPFINIIIVSTHFNKSFVMHMLDIGVSCYLAKDTAPEEFENSIRAISGKGFYYTSDVQKFIQEHFSGSYKQKAVKGFSLKITFTSRELEVLNLICNQYTNNEIGKKLFISSRTVEGHRNNLLSKTGCKNTAGLVAYAIQNNLVQIEWLPSFK